MREQLFRHLDSLQLMRKREVGIHTCPATEHSWRANLCSWPKDPDAWLAAGKEKGAVSLTVIGQGDDAGTADHVGLGR